MAFNPFRDLDPNDRERAIQQLGGANNTDLNVIRNRLRITTSLTKGIVDLLKRNNNTFKQDLDRIKLLDRRLKRVIPIIPGMAGVAGSVFGRPQRGPESGGGFPGLGGLPGGIPSGGGRPRPPAPTPVPSEVPVPETEERREQEVETPEEVAARKKREEKLKKANELVEAGKIQEASEILREMEEELGIVEPYVPPPVLIPDPNRPGQAIPVPSDPGVTPIYVQDVVQVLQEEREKTGKGQIYQTPDGFLVSVDKNGSVKVVSPKQINDQREAIRSNPGASILIISQALLDVVPGGRAPVRERGGKFGQRPTGGTKPQVTNLNRVRSRIVQVRTDRLRRRIAQERAATRNAKRKEERSNRYRETVLRRQQQEAERRRRKEEQEAKEGEEIIRQAQQAELDPDLAALGVDPNDPAARAAAEADIAAAENEPPPVRGTGGLAGLARKIPMEAVSDYTAASKTLTNFIPSLRVIGKDLKVAPGTHGDFLGLNNPTVRNNFVDYLEGIGRVGKSVTIGGKPAYDPDNLPVNVNFIRDILRAVGLPTLDNQGNIVRENPQGLIGTKTMGFIYNFMKTKQGLPVKDLLDELFIRDKISPDAYGIFLQKTMDDIEKGRVEQPGEIYPGFKLDPNLKFEGQESFQSLNIDTSGDTQIVIVLTGPKPANA